MGWILLILGVALWCGAHLFKRVAPEARASLGDQAGPGVVAGLLVLSIILMVFGYRWTGVIQVWYPPSFMIHLNNLLILIAIFLMSPAPKKGQLLHGMRHPMLAGFGLWAAAHLLVNGDLASILMFGGLLAWAVAEPVVINRAEPDWTPPEAGTLAMDARFLAGSVVLLLLIGWVHDWFGYCPFSSCGFYP